MALTYAIQEQYHFVAARAVLVQITKPNEAYPAGGYAPDKALLGFAVIHGVLPFGTTNLGLMVNWDRATNKLRYWFPTQETGTPGNYVGVEISGTVAAHIVSALILGV